MSSLHSQGTVRAAIRQAVLVVCLLGAAVVAGCGSTQVTSTSASSPLVHLPADSANHPKMNNEWWYVVGHLRSGTRTFGFETTIFRFSHIIPPGFSAPVSILRTDIAITDETGKRFLHQVTYHFPQDATVSNDTLHLVVGAASLDGSSIGNMTLRSSLTGGATDLSLSSRRAPMYVGGRGYLPFGNGFTYYYSLTDLATSGTLRLGGHLYHVSGISWLDHQWGNWNWRTIRGWTWMALQLSNGVQLSVFDFRSTVTRVKAASVLLANGKLRTIRSISVTPLGHWLSPHTGARYPSGWIVRIPSAGATLRVEPAVKDQEVTAEGERAGSYWEGSGRVAGTFKGRTVTGLSYTELTGYAGGFLSG